MEADRESSAAPGSGSEARADAVERRLQRLDTDGGPLRGRPPGAAGAGSTTYRRGGDPRRFDPKPHHHYCGIALHARTMYGCILNRDGAILVHRHLQARPEALRTAMAPSRDDLALAVEWMFAWNWRADRCAQAGLPFVLGHALYMKAIHGGKTKHDKIDAHKIAVLRRGGMRPQASGYPAARRATRDWLRRRLSLRRQRAALLAHVQNTNSQYHPPWLTDKSEAYAPPALGRFILSLGQPVSKEG